MPEVHKLSDLINKVALPILYSLSLNAANDFTVGAQTIVFPAGSTAGAQLCINIPIIDDVLVELLESFSVSAASNDPNVEFSAGGNLATVSITDNDGESHVVLLCNTQCMAIAHFK